MYSISALPPNSDALRSSIARHWRAHLQAVEQESGAGWGGGKGVDWESSIARHWHLLLTYATVGQPSPLIIDTDVPFPITPPSLFPMTPPTGERQPDRSCF